MSHKFDNVIAEAAYEIAGHGFAEEEYGEVSTTGWNALVTVSATTLLNIGADADLIERFRAEVPGIAGALAWIRESNEGFVTLVKHGTDEGLHSGIDIVNRDWDEFILDMNRRAADEDADETKWEVW